jgi:hypothetical protein
MIRGYLIWFLLSPLLISPSSCSKLISDEFPEYDQVPALNGILVAGEPLQLQLSMAEKIDTTELSLVNNASVRVSGPLIPEFELRHLKGGTYASNRRISPGEIYHCEATVDDYPLLQAADTVPSIRKVKIVWQSNQSRYNEEGDFMEGIEFTFTDDPSSEDFYEVAISKREYGNVYNMYAFNENCPILLNEGLDPFSTETLVFSDVIMTDSKVSMKLDFGGETRTNCRNDSCVQRFHEHTIILELRHVSRAYYNFKKSYYIYEKSRTPMFVEGTTISIPVYSNIVNGWGIFASYASSVDSMFVEEETIPLY